MSIKHVTPKASMDRGYASEWNAAHTIEDDTIQPAHVDETQVFNMAGLGIGSVAAWPLDVDKTPTVAGGLGIVANIDSTITATANDDILIGLNVSPTYDDDGKTGVLHYTAWIGPPAAAFTALAQSIMFGGVQISCLNPHINWAEAFSAVLEDDSVEPIMALFGAAVSTPAVSVTKQYVAAIEADAYHYGLGTTTDLVSIASYLQVEGGAVTNLVGFDVYQPSIANCVITNIYGVRIADHSGIGETTSENLHSAGASSLNVFEGVVQAKEVTLPPEAVPAAVEGKIYYDATANKLKFYNGAAWETISSAA